MGKPKAIPHEEEVRAVIRHELEQFVGQVEAVETSDVEVEFIDADVYVPAIEELGTRYNQDDLNSLVASFNQVRSVLIRIGVLSPDPDVPAPDTDEDTEELAVAPEASAAPVEPAKDETPPATESEPTPAEDDSEK